MRKQYQWVQLKKKKSINKKAHSRPKCTVSKSHTHRCFHMWLQGFSLTKATPERGFHLSNLIKYHQTWWGKTTATNDPHVADKLWAKRHHNTFHSLQSKWSLKSPAVIFFFLVNSQLWVALSVCSSTSTDVFIDTPLPPSTAKTKKCFNSQIEGICYSHYKLSGIWFPQAHHSQISGEWKSASMSLLISIPLR